MKYTIEMGSGSLIYVSRFHKDWFRHSKVVIGGYTCRHTDSKASHKPTFIFSK
jgi:hypothetical protein